MAVSIIHRATGTGLAVVGTLLLVWWLAAMANGSAGYAEFASWFTADSGSLSVFGYVLGIALTWAVFQHMGSGVRHLFLDQGANFELKGNRMTALSTFAFSVIATVGFWIVMLEKFNG